MAGNYTASIHIPSFSCNLAIQSSQNGTEHDELPTLFGQLRIAPLHHLLLQLLDLLECILVLQRLVLNFSRLFISGRFASRSALRTLLNFAHFFCVSFLARPVLLLAPQGQKQSGEVGYSSTN
jgi:hypothetical protein